MFWIVPLPGILEVATSWEGLMRRFQMAERCLSFIPWRRWSGGRDSEDSNLSFHHEYDLRWITCRGELRIREWFPQNPRVCAPWTSCGTGEHGPELPDSWPGTRLGRWAGGLPGSTQYQWPPPPTLWLCPTHSWPTEVFLGEKVSPEGLPATSVYKFPLSGRPGLCFCDIGSKLAQGGPRRWSVEAESILGLKQGSYSKGNIRLKILGYPFLLLHWPVGPRTSSDPLWALQGDASSGLCVPLRLRSLVPGL